MAPEGSLCHRASTASRGTLVKKRIPRGLSLQPCSWSTKSVLYKLFAKIVAGLLLISSPLWGQAQSQVQYFYDAAGNLVQVTRSSVPAQPDLKVTNLAVGAIIFNANGSYGIPVTFQVNNIGSATANATWYDRGYLSNSAVLHDTDQALAGYNTRSINLASGASYSVSTTFTTSATTPSGSYTLIVKSDGGNGASGQYSPTGPNLVAEPDESNNVQAVAVILSDKADLAVSTASIGAVTVNQVGAYSFPVTWTVANNGVAVAAPTWYDVGYLSGDATLDNADEMVGYLGHFSALGAGASYTTSTTYTTATTTAPGNYTLVVKADGRGGGLGGTNTDAGVVAEGSETNNTRALSITLPTRPDLSVSSMSIGAITVNQAGAYSFPVTYTVTNNGASPAASVWYDTGYLSANATLDNADAMVGYVARTTVLAAGASYTTSTTYTTATTTTPGNYTLFIKADGRGGGLGGTNTDAGVVAEGSETNNTRALSITLPTKPDLVISNVSVGAIVKNANQSKSIPVTYTVTNGGAVSAAPAWYDLAYLSTNATLDNSDVNLSGYNVRSTALAAAASYTQTITFTTPTNTPAGSYTLFIKADGHGAAIGSGTNADSGAVTEGSESNNVAQIPVVLP